MSQLEEALFLCLDQGGHASRAIVVDDRGEIRAQAFREIDTHRDGVHVEHAPDQIISTLQAAADEVVASLGDKANRIKAAGFATQRSSIACWDRSNGEALSPILSWQDTRADEWLQTFSAHESAVHDITGLMLSPHYGVSKLRWCLDNLEPVREAFADDRLVFGPLAAFIARQMLESAPSLADPANASRTLLWDRRARDWSQDLLEKFDIPEACLPSSVPSRYEWGDIVAAGRRIPVRVITGDQSAALFAFGMPARTTVYANLGTGAFLQKNAGADLSNPGRLLASVVYQDADTAISVVEGTVNGAGSAINLITEELGLEHDVMRANSAAWLQQYDDLPLFLNRVAGLGSPWWQANQQSEFLGTGNREQKIAAVIESVAFLITVNLQAMQQAAGESQTILVTGGLGAVDPLLQRIADLTSMQIKRPRVKEATARGLAFLLAGLPEEWPAPQITAEFSPQQNTQLQERFRIWLQAMPEIPAQSLD